MTTRRSRRSAATLRPPTLPRRILLAGASGDIGRALLKRLLPTDGLIGIHHFSERGQLEAEVRARAANTQVAFFQADVRHPAACRRVVDDFVAWAGGIDALVQLAGGVSRPIVWTELEPHDWQHDIDLNLTGTFFLAQRTFKHMRDTNGARGGKIVLVSTASAAHGGGPTSMAYGIAKAGVECLVKGLAKEGARDNILVNGVAPGFIETRFHTLRMRRTARELKRRAELVPLKRAGKPDDVAALIVYLLSDWNKYITGECVAVSGGDFL
jgi:3-oxoacyl-[acyl-carrier protein] reductase